MHKLLALFATSFVKVFVMAVYGGWAVKVLVHDSPTPLFGFLALILSVYGLWSLVSAFTAYVLTKVSTASQAS